MTVPYTPIALAQSVINPSVGGSGSQTLPYLSCSQYGFAPTAMDTSKLTTSPAPGSQPQALDDTIRRASRWADNICFGADPAAKGASLAASLSVESVWTRFKNNELRLVCDYKPILQLVGCDIGQSPASVSSIAGLAPSVRFGRRTIYVPMTVPFAGVVNQPPTIGTWGSVYAVWSYVNGYPHTQLVEAVAAGATSCVVEATDGNGGLWGVYPGTELTVYQGAQSERITVSSVVAGSATATINTVSPMGAHYIPAAPDFVPVTTIPADVQQAVISLTTMLIKTRGARSLVMPQTPGQAPGRQALAQAGALEDWEIAQGILARYAVRTKVKV